MPRRKKVEEEEEEEEEVFHVEVITKARVSDEGDWEYFVKWAGYNSDSDSWEPSSNVQQCDRLLESFWKHVGMDNEDYAIGHVIEAKEDWIEREKRYFQDTFVKRSKRKSEKTTKKNRQEERKSKSSTSHISESSADDSQSSDEEPYLNPPAKRLHRQPLVVDTDSESGSDGHLREQVKAVSRPKATTQPSKENPKVSTRVKRPELPLATGGSTSIAPPKVVRTHQDQRNNPLVKPLGLPSKSVEAGSSLSTKQRIAAGIPPPPTGPKPLPPAPKKALPALSFKKIKPAIPSASQTTKETMIPSTSVATPTSPTVRTTDITNDVAVVTSPLVASPQPMDVDQPIDLWGSISDDGGPIGGSSDIPTVSIPSKSQEEIDTEKFLQTVHIPVLNSSLEAHTMPDELVQPTTDLIKALAISKIPKKWKWSGDLFITTSESKTELLCAVNITDPSGTSNTSHINLLLSLLDSLRISKLHSIMDLSPLIRACGKSQYFGILESNEPSEEPLIHGLKHHLTSEGLAAAIPLLLDAMEVAVLIVFSGVQQGLAEFLGVPDQLQSGTSLIVGLLPFTVPTVKSTEAAGWRSVDAVIQSFTNQQDVLVPHEFPQQAMLYQAMSLLCFPKALLDFLNSSPSTRTYCIWPSPDQMLPGLDTIMLQYILESTKAMSAKVEEDVRVVFISNQHLETLHTMPSLVTKLANAPEIQFWMYGYSANMTCQSWQVQEVYPLGGVVTFTASALVEDLMGCYQLMFQIIEHPSWDCYLVPEVLAVTHLLCSNGGLDSSSESCLAPILDFINLGLISVLRMPQMGHSNQMAWLSQTFHQSSASGDEMLEAYLGVLRNHPTASGMKAEQLITWTNNEITKDLLNAQIQPTLMENYRRFVVIRAASEDTIPFDKDGLEWSPLSLFSFKDDYFQP
ncbi:hypothetical protein V8E55_000808 [Tylopilus felleus]